MTDEPKRTPVPNDELSALMTEALAQGGVFEFAPTGRSMLPTLREHRDTVTMRAPGVRPVKKRDVVLYRRGDGHLVLHRVIRVCRDGSLTLCGDNQVVPEPGVRAEQLIGVMCTFTRDGRRVSADSPAYRAYAAFLTAVRPIRRIKRHFFG